MKSDDHQTTEELDDIYDVACFVSTLHELSIL